MRTAKLSTFVAVVATLAGSAMAEVEVRDALGNVLPFQQPPERIAATVPAAVDILLALGVTPVVRPYVPGMPPVSATVEAIPTIAVGHRAGPDLERLAAAQPDLIVTGPMFAQFVPAMRDALGVPVYVMSIERLEDVSARVRDVGRIVRREARAEQVTASLQAELSAIVEGLPERGPDVFAMMGSSQAFYGFLPDSYLGSLIEQLNGRLITEGGEPASAARSLTPFSLERVVAADPAVILIVEHGEGGARIEELCEGPAWSGLRAVGDHRVHALSAWLYLLNPGPRAPEALRNLRALLYPHAE